MTQPKRTSEDRLLDIIENPTLPLKKVPRRIVRGGISQKISELIQRIPLKKETLVKLLNVQVVNNVAIFICISLTIFFVIDFQVLKISLEKKIKNQNIDTQSLYLNQNKGNFLPVNISKMNEYAQMRNVFSFIAPAKEEDHGEDFSQQYQELSKFIKNLSLVGIIWAEESPQAIIEDKKTERTHLVAEGDKLEEFEVKKVFSDSVILSAEEKEWTIK